MKNNLVLFSGNANKKLSEDIAYCLNISLGKSFIGNFNDGETRIELYENVRGADVFIIQPTCPPVNQNLMEALIMADACKRASASRITLVAPYFGYARQDRKSLPRTPITAKLVSDLIEISGFDRLLTLDLHTSAIQGFFDIPVDHLFSKKIFYQYCLGTENVIVVSPDAGGVPRARALAKYFKCGLAIIDKRRDKPNQSTVMNIIGDVKGKNCLIFDDMIDTAGSLVESVETLYNNGAFDVKAAITHPVLSSNAIERVKNSKLTRLIVSDSIPLKEDAMKIDKIKVLSIAELIATAVERIHNSKSISKLFD
jgi:ribose-phosphate pyrophosphokinase